MYRLDQAPRFGEAVNAIPSADATGEARVLFARRLHIFVYFSTPLLQPHSKKSRENLCLQRVETVSIVHGV